MCTYNLTNPFSQNSRIYVQKTYALYIYQYTQDCYFSIVSFGVTAFYYAEILLKSKIFLSPIYVQIFHIKS